MNAFFNKQSFVILLQDLPENAESEVAESGVAESRVAESPEYVHSDSPWRESDTEFVVSSPDQ